MAQRDTCRLDAGFCGAAVLPDASDQLPTLAGGLGGLDVGQGEPADAGTVYSGYFEVAVHQHVGQDHALASRVPAFDVGSGVGLGIAQALGLSQGVGVALAGLHLRQNVVGSAV